MEMNELKVHDRNHGARTLGEHKDVLLGTGRKSAGELGVLSLANFEFVFVFDKPRTETMSMAKYA